MTANGPPPSAPGALLEVEEEEEVEEGEVEKEVELDDVSNGESDAFIMQNLARIAQLASEQEAQSVQTQARTSDLYAYATPPVSTPVPSPVPGPLSVSISNTINSVTSATVVSTGVSTVSTGESIPQQDSQETFAKLLKATMDQQTESAVGKYVRSLYIMIWLKSNHH